MGKIDRKCKQHLYYVSSSSVDRGRERIGLTQCLLNVAASVRGGEAVPANTRRRPNAGLLLAHGPRR